MDGILWFNQRCTILGIVNLLYSLTSLPSFTGLLSAVAYPLFGGLLA